jgi:phosphoenolpyruvate phosphomutase
MYYATPTELFRQAGLSTVIWANHSLRAAITGMREVTRRIFEDQSLMEVEGRIAGVKDIFRLVGNAELEAAEKRYLPNKSTTHAVILAASGGDLGELTRDRPKCMIDIRGQSLLQRLVSTLSDSGVRKTTVVRGYRKESVAARGIATVDNDRYAETGELYSLSRAKDELEGETIVVYGDVLFRHYILAGLMATKGDIVLAVDARDRTAGEGGRIRDLVAADRPFAMDYLDDDPVHLRRMAADLDPSEISGEWIGLVRFSAQGATWLREEMDLIEAEGLLETADLPLLFTRLAAKHPIVVQYFTAHWLDVDTLNDLADARNFT